MVDLISVLKQAPTNFHVNMNLGERGKRKEKKGA
jgi:hypothetical protein